MTGNKRVIILFVSILSFFKVELAYAQAPVITYQTPQIYTVNTPVTALSPQNTGGAVPPNIYGHVTTFVGTGKAGAFNGTGTASSISGPFGLTVDAEGNIYVGDYNNNLIRKITPLAVVTTYAGIANQYGTNNGLASKATFALPQGVAIDKVGNIYVADSYNDLIRKIEPNGIVSTLAGQAGVAGAVNGTSATFTAPSGVAVDNSGNIFVADQGNNLIRKITSMGLVSTFAGTAGVTGAADGTNATFNSPTELVFDHAGNLYVTDTYNNLIRKITPAGVVSTFAGSGATGAQDGQGISASFNNPDAIAVDSYNTLYVADEKNNMVRKISPGGLVSTLAGNGAGGSIDGIDKTATFSYPGSIAVDNTGDVYVGDINTYLIRKVAVTGYTIDIPLPPGMAFDATTGTISGIPTAPSQSTNYTVTAYNTVGSSSTVINITVKSNLITTTVPPDISYKTPQTYYVNTAITPLAPSNSGGAVPGNIYGLVTTFAGNGQPANVNGTGVAASFNNPASVIFDNNGNLYVSEILNNDIREITPSGVVTTFAGTGKIGTTNGPGTTASFNSPEQLAIDKAQNLYVADESNELIRKITPAGIVSIFANSGSFGSTGTPVTTTTFNNPVGLVIDPAGNFYVGDRGNSTIRKIDVTGQVTTFAVFNGGSTPSTPDAGINYLATDANANLYFGNTNQVIKSTAAGAMSTIAGSNNPGYINGAAAASQFFNIGGVAVDAINNIYITDSYNSRIRKISASGVVSTLAGENGRGAGDGIGSSAGFNLPYGVTVDPTQNYLYVADMDNNAIRKISITGYSIDKTLPNGLVFDPATGIISGTPSFATPPEVYTITGYNTAGSSTTTVNIQILEATITFGPLPLKTVCDVDFDPGATGSNAITYTSDNSTIAEIVSGKIHITGAGTTVITASDGISSATQILTVTPAIIPVITISPVSPQGCTTAPITFTAITNVSSTASYQWQINGENSGTNSPQFMAGNLNQGDQISCTLTTTTVCVSSPTVTSNIAAYTAIPLTDASVKITSSEPGPICFGTPVTFTAIPFTSAVKSYQWQVNGANAGSGQSTFTSSTLTDGSSVTCVLTSEGACFIDSNTTSNAIVINLNPVSQCVVDIPNAFTPNGDGINDKWDISALETFPNCTVAIFNRYGSLVYNSINYPKSWDGTLNGKQLPVGVYYYLIDLKNGKKPLSGSITLLR